MIAHHRVTLWKAAPVLAFGALLAALGLSGCGEIDQKAKIEKVYAGKTDSRPADDPRFKGDRAKWEETLKKRSEGQNEYLRTGGAAK
jgi:hypothetical protein